MLLCTCVQFLCSKLSDGTSVAVSTNFFSQLEVFTSRLDMKLSWLKHKEKRCQNCMLEYIRLFDKVKGIMLGTSIHGAQKWCLCSANCGWKVKIKQDFYSFQTACQIPLETVSPHTFLTSDWGGSVSIFVTFQNWQCDIHTHFMLWLVSCVEVRDEPGPVLLS